VPSVPKFDRCSLVRILVLSLTALACVKEPSTSAAGQSQVESADTAADHLTLQGIERRAQAVYAAVAPAIGRIEYAQPENSEVRYGSGGGVIVTADGYVITTGNATRALFGDTLVIHLPDGRRVKAAGLGWSTEWNIGLVKIAESGTWPHVELARAAKGAAGQLCVALGYPYRWQSGGLRYDSMPNLSLGSVTQSSSTWFTSSCRANDHGSGLFNLDGQLLGLTSGITPGKDTLHTQADVIRSHLPGLIAGKNLDRDRLVPAATESTQSSVSDRSQPQQTEDDGTAAAGIARAKQASIRFRAVGSDSRGLSGVIVTPDGHVVTCGHHRRLPGERVEIFLPDGRDVAGVVLGTNFVSDVGVLKITDQGPWPYAEMGDSTILKPGSSCVVMGYPVEHLGRQPLVRETTTIEPEGDAWSTLLWTSKYDQRPGNSGGGIFDREGRVVGVVKGGTVRVGQEQMFHVRIEVLRKQWEALSVGTPVEVQQADPLAESVAVFDRLGKDSQPAVLEVLRDNSPCAIGTIISSDGKVITKASELFGEISCRLADGRVLAAKVENVSSEHDLAILKIDATNLSTIAWSASLDTSVGSLVAAILPGKAPSYGVVSIAARSIPADAGSLGVELRDSDRGLVVERAPQRGGLPLRQGDIILELAGRPTPNLNAYRELIAPSAGAAIAVPGDPIRVSVRRSDESLQLHFQLPSRSGESQRSSSFQSVFDIQVPLKPNLCGGPIIDTSGRAVGISIAAREQGRTHVVPAMIVRGLMN